jgi:signal transduction histidine kinase
LETLKILPKADPKNAATYAQEYMALNDSLQTEDRKIRNKFARIQFETEEVVAENKFLARQRQLWTGIALTMLLLGLSAFVIVSQRVKNQRLRFQQEQQTSNQEISNLLLSQGAKLEEGKQIEQKRISEELHDGVQGRLQGVRMMLLGLNKRDDDIAKGERARAIVMLKDVQEEVRAISHELSHAAYQKINNFILSIKDLLQNVENSTKIKIDFIFVNDLDYDALTGEIKINLYRIIQECVQNAVKHAACHHIKISFDANLETLRIVIADDGKGFVVKKGKKGIGTRNITSRVKKVNGTWQLDSMIGEGTKVSLQIPIVSYDNSKFIRIAQEDLLEF